ncbi:TRAP transporter small permease subunit [Natribacillus halophilus]|uniref:TRAP-type mannitol/chloroaromatic compound transport system, small permease component n=1 Tax=Natribacillus halophilus TaxID=549003 RepID=A0A1G8N5N1_9BACI|nr:TRAP transporter small permease subunit [Natribacillus halophilus]SDI75502.1 TRAP-type mannitol/chloroaromatic compound transport system, small permease component [Natribacillus halophilus]
MKVWNKVELGIDFVSECLGRIGWVLILFALVFGLSDVILRYIFGQPSLWISVTIQYSMVLLACVSGAYSLNKGSFVKLDVFYERFSPRIQAICDIITFVFAFMYLYVLITRGIEAAELSFIQQETTPTAVPIPLYHLKAIIPFGAFCVLLVVIKHFVQDIRTALGYENR